MKDKPANGFLPQALRDGVLVPAGTLRAAQADPRFGPGAGVFETVRVAGGRARWLEDHAARLKRAAGWMAARTEDGNRTAAPDAGCNLASLAERCAAVVAANGMSEGSLKIIVGRENGGWTEVMLARAARYGPEQHAAGFRLRTAACGARSAERDGWKTLYRPHHDGARAAAAAAGYDEALWIGPGGRVLEGAVTNLFMVRDGCVFTPPPAAGILPGIARARVIRLTGAGERDFTLGELQGAQEVFVTNALLGIMPVAQIDDRRFEVKANGVTRDLREGLAEISIQTGRAGDA